ncbi:MAG: hypothetical protein HOP10_05760 [Chitinophagaceae bacterium]|nr:hypothetical protein [Chitinophagaceae bacterium]
MSNGVQHKLIGYEVTPLPGVWDKIAAELDESELHHVFPSTIYQAEVAAPPGVWNKIEAGLASESEVFFPKQRTITPWLRYAAAAVLIGFVAWGGVQVLNNKKENASIASSETAQPQNSNSGTSAAIEEQPDVNSDRADEARDDAALEASKKTYARLDVPVNAYKLKNIASAYHFASDLDMTEPDNYVTGRNPDDLNNRYIVMMTPDGHFVRMAKKLSNMICCVSGEEQDKECVDQMSRWKEKMACSPTGHSTGSFLDILSLIKSLEDQ